MTEIAASRLGGRETGTARARLAEAVRQHAAGKLQEAEAIYRDILREDPDNPDALNLLGALALVSGYLDQAEALTARAIELAPHHAAFHNNLGNILLALRRPADAEACLRRGLELDSTSPECHSNLGLAMSAQGRFDQATDCFRRALELRPGMAEVLGNLGIALKARGWLDEAIEALQESGEKGGFDADLTTHLVLALHQAGRTDEAIKRAEAALPQCRHSAVFRNAYGRILLDAGRPVRASHLFRGVLGMGAEFPEARSNLETAMERTPADEALHEALFRRIAEGAVEMRVNLQPLRAVRSTLITETLNNAMLLAMIVANGAALFFLPIGTAVWGIAAIVTVYFGFGGMLAESILRRRVDRRIRDSARHWVECWAAGAVILASTAGKGELVSPKNDWRLAAEDPDMVTPGASVQ